jgi:hypothetical protein
MLKWEYSCVTFLIIENEWKVFKINGKLPIPPIQYDINYFLSEYGNEGWELVSEIYLEDDPIYNYAWVYSSEEFETIINRITNNTINYINGEYKYYQVVGILPKMFDGYTNGWYILLTYKKKVLQRRLTFKRPVNE